MQKEEGTIFLDYLKSMDNVLIYLSNLSPYYILSVLVSILAVSLACWYRTANDFISPEIQSTNERDEEPEQVDREELNSKTDKLKDDLESMLNAFPDSLITEEFIHKDKDMTESTEDTLEVFPREDASGGDGNFNQQKDPDEKQDSNKSNEEVDPYSFLPNPMSRFKKARQAAIMQRVTGDMSVEQLLKEKEAEATQIAAIWDLLKQQKEQFNIGTEQELEEQLHLYCL